jgi:hypothetical protein
MIVYSVLAIFQLIRSDRDSLTCTPDIMLDDVSRGMGKKGE